MRKYDVAVQLRDAAFDMLSHEGRFEEIGDGLRLVILRTGSLKIGMRTPFRKVPGPKAPEGYAEAVRHSKYEEQPPYGIDVWSGQKVFSVTWAGGNPLTVISFKRGAWEDELVTAARAAGAAAP